MSLIKNTKSLIMMVLGVLAVAGVVFAYRGDYTAQGPNYSEERHEIMDKAFEQNDYATWKEQMQLTGRTPRVLQIVNEDNFHLFAQAHEAAKEGNYELAQQLRTELGLNNGVGPRDGTGYKSGSQGQQKGMRHSQGSTQKMNYVDSDNDGVCDNMIRN